MSNWMKSTGNWLILKDPYHSGQNALIKGDIKKLSSMVLNSQSKKTGLSLFHYFIINSKDITLDYSQVLDHFLKSGVDINSQSNKSHGYYSALHFAVGYPENYELTKLLVEKGIDIKLRDEYGNTAFWNACFNYRGLDVQRKIIDYLYDKGASIEDTNNSDVSIKKLITQRGEGIDQGHNPKEWDLRKLKINQD